MCSTSIRGSLATPWQATAGLLYGAPPGLKSRLPSSLLRSYAEAGATARNHPFNFRFIGHR